MTVRDVFSVKRTPSLPSPYLLQPGWKTDALFGLPQTELKAWYANMEAGFDLSKNDITFDYRIGERSYAFSMAPNRLFMPDGSVVTFDKRRVAGEGLLGSGDPQSSIAQRLKSSIRYGNIHVVGLGRSQNQFIDEMVAEQFRLVSELGVERHGSFENILGTLRHRTYETGVRLIVSLNRYLTDDSGHMLPDMSIEIQSVGKRMGEFHCDYHSHPGAGNIHPSEVDLLFMRSRGESSTVIATKQSDGSYRVVEWRLKKGVEIDSELEAHAYAAGMSPPRFLRGKALLEFVDRNLEKKEYLLAAGGAGMVFRERRPQQQP